MVALYALGITTREITGHVKGLYGEDGLKGFPEATETVYPKTQIQLCIIHLVRHSLRYVSWKERQKMAVDLGAVYASATAEAAEQALEAFEKKWQSRLPSIAGSWRSNWTHIIPFFAFPLAIRRAIYTTNAVELVFRT